ncbi:MAG: hypothetical protein HKN59_02100 [Gammaproteobacteria bacterium]|nr:hypothetical protein [Gammaproteobacteria bacterium]
MIAITKPGFLKSLLILSAAGLASISSAQNIRDLASFSITPSEPGIAAGSGFVGDEFQFKAELSTAKCFELAPEAGFDPPLRQPAADGVAVFTHKYEDVGTYRATMRAYRDRDCDDPDLQLDEAYAVKLDLDVIVKRPPVISETPASRAQFLVARSDPGDPARWAEFVFTADVSQARSYLLDAGDGKGLQQVTSRLPGGVRIPYRYDSPGKFTAVLQAERASGESVELRQLVTVVKPPPVRTAVTAPVKATQWPDATRVTSAAPEGEDDDLLLWLLLAAGAVVALGSLTPGMAATEVLDFVPTKDRGTFNVASSTDRNNLLATRVWWRDSPRFRLSDGAAVTNIRSKIRPHSQ